jgi:bacterioferritin B
VSRRHRVPRRSVKTIWAQNSIDFVFSPTHLNGVMLISKKINDAINQQIGNEFGASLQYVAIAAHFDAEALPQLAAHFYKQAEEERDHAMRFVKFLVETDGELVLPTVKAPKGTFASAEEAVQLSLDWEVEVTQQIHKLVDLAKKEVNYTTDNFLQWFVKEQLEEVSSMDNLLKVIRRAGEKGLLRVEEYLARKGSQALPEEDAT